MTANLEKVLAVIPARWGSTRFPGKALHPIAGKPLVQHVWERVSQCQNLDAIVVATDDERIVTAVENFGGRVIMTSSKHHSGTDRIAEVAHQFPNYALLLNIQGDEPLIAPSLIDSLARALQTEEHWPMITAAHPLSPDDAAVSDPHVVKVVLDAKSCALYFSRSPIPYPRELPENFAYYRHHGIYGYRRETLLQLVEWPPSLLERAEGLEQLRALENGITLRVVITDETSLGVDTPEQAVVVERILQSQDSEEKG